LSRVEGLAGLPEEITADDYETLPIPQTLGDQLEKEEGEPSRA